MNSMTGFGRVEETLGSHRFSIEIKSVNHRFLDVRFRMPPSFSGWESDLTEEIRNFCERGSLDVSVRQKIVADQGNFTGTTRYAVDDKALESFKRALVALESKTQQKWELTLSDLLRMDKIFVPVEDLDDKNLGLAEFLPVFKKALQDLLKMRQKEGAKLKSVLHDGIGEMQKHLEDIQALVPSQAAKIKEKLESRLAQWNLSSPIEPSRLEWEVALMAEKSDIKEEIDRLTAHFSAFLEALESKKPVGRKLDFLIQELNREVNTIASKTTLMEITQLTVRLKSNIEKLREQVQNVE